MSWLPTLFAAETIPSAMITFVALLMFVQQGVGWGASTFLCSLLTVPWLLRSLFRARLSELRWLPWFILGVEAAIFLMLVALAFSFSGGEGTVTRIFLCLVVLCSLCACHDVASQSFYERLLPTRVQRLYDGSKMFFSQSAVVFTYGAMIMLVGTFEVIYCNYSHAIARSWSMAVYLLAGAYLILLISNLLLLPKGGRQDVRQERRPDGDLSSRPALPWQARWKSSSLLLVLSLGLVLLPQSIMFHTRVLFLVAPVSDGGLGCSLQWVGLAQGTVGVMAFSAGLGMGQWLLQHVGRRPWLPSTSAPRRLYWSMVIPLGVSPFIYWLMTQRPPSGLLPLCVATAVAQFCFGYGLNSCTMIVRRISGDRYRSTTSYLYIPLIALVMLPPMALSGWLAGRMGFVRFFTLDALLSLPAWVAAAIAYARFHDYAQSK